MLFYISGCAYTTYPVHSRVYMRLGPYEPAYAQSPKLKKYFYGEISQLLMNKIDNNDGLRAYLIDSTNFDHWLLLFWRKGVFLQSSFSQISK